MVGCGCNEKENKMKKCWILTKDGNSSYEYSPLPVKVEIFKIEFYPELKWFWIEDLEESTMYSYYSGYRVSTQENFKNLINDMRIKSATISTKDIIKEEMKMINKIGFPPHITNEDKIIYKKICEENNITPPQFIN